MQDYWPGLERDVGVVTRLLGLSWGDRASRINLSPGPLLPLHVPDPGPIAEVVDEDMPERGDDKDRRQISP